MNRNNFIHSTEDNYLAYLPDWDFIKKQPHYKGKLYTGDNIVLLSYKHKGIDYENRIFQSLFYIDNKINKVVDVTTSDFGSFEKCEWIKGSYQYFDKTGVWKNALPNFKLDLSFEYEQKIKLHSRFKIRDSIKSHLFISPFEDFKDWTWGVASNYLDPGGFISLYSDKPETVEVRQVCPFTIRMLFESVS